jgi:Protein of unknown function (DUF3179)
LRERTGCGLTFEEANSDATALIDRETRSRWDAYGNSTSGKLKGTQLEILILQPEYWFAWSEFHPKTTIFAAPPLRHLLWPESLQCSQFFDGLRRCPPRLGRGKDAAASEAEQRVGVLGV